MTKERLNKWTVRVHRENLDRASDGDAVVEAWKKVPKNLQGDADLLGAYFSGLIRGGLHEKAEKDLAAALKSDWRGPLVRAVRSRRGTECLEAAETRRGLACVAWR